MSEQNWGQKEFVEWYNRELGFNAKQMEEYQRYLNLQTSDIILDLGCGNGDLLTYVSKMVKLAIGVDGSSEQLALAKNKLLGIENIRLINANFEDISINNPEFSNICATKVSARKSLHHLTDVQKGVFFDKLSDIVCSGGMFLIEDMIFNFPIADLLQNKAKVLAEAQGFYGGKWSYMEKAFTGTMLDEFPTGMPELRKLLTENGFKVEMEEFRACFYGVVLAKRL